MKNKKLEERITNWIIKPIVLSMLPLAVYAMTAAEHGGSWDYRKWSEIDEQQRQEKSIQQQKTYRQEFYELDKNPADGVIDSTEFIYRK